MSAVQWLQNAQHIFNRTSLFLSFAPTHLHRSDRLMEEKQNTQPPCWARDRGPELLTQKKNHDLKPNNLAVAARACFKDVKRKTGRPYPFYARTPRAGSRDKRTIAHVTMVPHGCNNNCALCVALGKQAVQSMQLSPFSPYRTVSRAVFLFILFLSFFCCVAVWVRQYILCAFAHLDANRAVTSSWNITGLSTKT